MNIKNLYKKWKWEIWSFCYRHNVIHDWYKERIRAERLESILKRQFTKEELKRAEHFHGIEEKNKKQWDELEKLNKFLVDREVKMIELKKEIKILEEKLAKIHA